jgi:GPH family glycoside/pentoside/hexuronide:cation symporter
MALLFGVVCLLTMLTTVASTGWVPQISPAADAPSFVMQIRGAWANPRYRNLLAVNFCQKLGEGIGYGSFAYFVIYVVHQPLSVMGTVVLCAMTAQAVSQPFWVWLSARLRRETLYIIGVCGWCVNLGLWLTMDGAPYWMLGLVGIQAGISSGGFLTVVLAMLGDAIAADSVASGVNREGIYTGFWLAIEKFAFALGALVVGALLGVAGFVEGESGRQVMQSADTITGIAVIYVGVNGLVYLASIIPAVRAARLSFQAS